FDDEIESIRCFDAENQVSLEETGEAVIGPGAAFFIKADGREEGIARLKTETELLASKLKGEKKKRCLDRTERLLDYLEDGGLADVTEQLLPYFYEEAYIEHYLPSDGIVIIEEAARIREEMTSDDQALADIYAELCLEGDILPCYTDIFRKTEKAFADLDRPSLISFSFIHTPTGLDTELIDDICLREFTFYRTPEERGDEIEELTLQGEVYLCAYDEKSRARMEGIVETRGLNNCRVIDLPIEQSLEAYAIPA
ncbi:MAG: hypothetical protein IIY02_05380, partial [Firmicutes bacterium]|nr:hypothetical protein [Bacillota bacterium]